MWKIIYYETETGECPVYEFINSLSIKMSAKAAKEIELLEEFGNTLKMPYSRSLQDGINELRIQAEGNICRILYFFYVEKQIILTHGFIKKTGRTPPNEIDLALSYRTDYIRRFKK